MDAWPRPPQPHPLAALDATDTPVLRSNPLYTEEEEQEIIITVDSLEEAAPECEEPPAARAPRRVPSTSSGYGSGGSGSGSHGRATPSPPALQHIPKTADFALERTQNDATSKRLGLNGVEDVGAERSSPKRGDDEYERGKEEGRFAEVPIDAIVLRIAAPEEEPERPLSRSLREDIRACLERPERLEDIESVLSAALEGAGGVAAARLRLQAALLALGPPPSAPAHQAGSPRAPALPYCGPGVRPGDVTMMPKSTDMSLLAASALFTLDAAKGEVLARRLARGRRRRRRCRAVVAVAILALLLAAVGCAELVLSRGTRMFGVLLS